MPFPTSPTQRPPIAQTASDAGIVWALPRGSRACLLLRVGGVGRLVAWPELLQALGQFRSRWAESVMAAVTDSPCQAGRHPLLPSLFWEHQSGNSNRTTPLARVHERHSRSCPDATASLPMLSR